LILEKSTLAGASPFWEDIMVRKLRLLQAAALPVRRYLETKYPADSL